MAAPTMNGKWAIHRNIEGNAADSTCTFVQKENAISGNCVSGGKEVQVTGAVESDKVTWTYKMDYEGSPISVTYKAALNDSGKLSGTVDIQPYGVSGDFTATLVKEEGQK